MTTKPKARRFRLRLSDEATQAARPSVAPQARASSPDAAQHPAAPPTSAAAAGNAAGNAAGEHAHPPRAEDSLFDEPDAPATPPAPPRTGAPRTAPQTMRADAEIDAIRAEEFTGRQLRMAMRVAQRHGAKAASGLEAVRLLRARGIDPFEPSTLLDLVRDQSKANTSRALTTTKQPALPKTYRQPAPPATIPDAAGATTETTRRSEVSRVQKDIVRRRRRRMALLGARLMVFVGLPTLLAAWYFFVIATPLYATNSEFVIQQADSPSAAPAGGLAGMLGGGGLGMSLQDNVTVQSYLQSREAMRRLDAEQDFKAYFQQDEIDPLRRLAPDTTDEAAFRLYQDVVQVSYDPTEGIIRMEVIAADPDTSERFAHALVRYAEEQVDQLTQRLRENQMSDAMDSVTRAEQNMNAAQMHVLDLQERYQVLSSEVEVTLLTQQITALETLLNQERLSLDDLSANARPNQARLAQAQRRIATLAGQIDSLRSQLTQSGADGLSVARVQRELVMAESDVATRQMLLAQAMQQMEIARTEANRQVRYLSLGVSPIAPDEPTYPRAFENTALAFLIFSGIYLMISMTTAILREQVTG